MSSSAAAAAPSQQQTQQQGPTVRASDCESKRASSHQQQKSLRGAVTIEGGLRRLVQEVRPTKQ